LPATSIRIIDLPLARQPHLRTLASVVHPDPASVASSGKPRGLSGQARRKALGETAGDLVTRWGAHAILSFYTPAASERTRDLHEIWQLIYSDDLVRHALVACFSSILGQKTQSYSLNRQSFGRALQSLRIRLARRQIGASENISLRTSITYIGLMDVGSTSQLPACFEVTNAFASVLDQSGVMIRLDIGGQVHICS